jgi:sRNA-binding protein
MTLISDENRAKGIIEMLARRFPQAFSVVEKDRKPLKLGIFSDLVAALDGSVEKEELSAALRAYVRHPGYLRKCRPGVNRVDLSSNVAGMVSRREAKFARVERDRVEDARRR